MRNVVRWKVSMEFGAAERSLIGQLALHLGFPRDESSLRSYLSGENGTLIDLLPELGTLRDVSFYVCCSTSTHAASECHRSPRRVRLCVQHELARCL
jgi:hypothetical protein